MIGEPAKFKLDPLRIRLIKVLKSHVEDGEAENMDFAWLLLALVSGHVHLEDPHFVMDYFNLTIHAPEGVGLYTLLQVKTPPLSVISTRMVCKYLEEKILRN